MSAIVVRVAAGTPCPAGFTEGISTRRTKLCYKQSSNPVAEAAAVAAALPPPIVPDAGMDDLAGLFGSMTVNQPAIVELTHLMNMMGMTGQGRRRRSTKKARKTRRRRL
jgi:hypothetical protein